MGRAMADARDPDARQSLGGRDRRRAAARRPRCCRTAWPTRRLAGPPAVAMGGRRGRAGRGWCPGCRSLSASASSSISPPTASRPGGRQQARRLPACVIAFLARRRALGFAIALGFAAIAAGFATATLRTDAHRASGAGVPGRERDGHRLCRNPRGARAQRPHRGARAAHRRRAGSMRRPTACGWRCARARRRRSAASSRSRRICRRRSRRCGRAATTSRATCISSASAPPAMRSARSRSPAPPVGRGVWLRYAAVHRRHPRGDRQAHPRGAAGRPRLDRVRADHRQARRDLDAGQ